MLNFTIYFMLIMMSMISVQFGTISINKIGIIPFYIYLLLHECKDIHTLVINKKSLIYILFLISTTISAFLAIIIPIKDTSEFMHAQINYIIQVIFIYLPIFIILMSSNNKKEYLNVFFEALVKVIRFHAIFIIIQFIIYTIFKVNISSLFFDQLLKGITGKTWTSHVYGTYIVLRASGLNYDPAFASYLLICGIIFDKNKNYKYLYLLCAMLAQSRTGFVCAIIVLLFTFMLKFNFREKIKFKYVFNSLLIILILIILLKNEQIRVIIFSLSERLRDIFMPSSVQDISTLRHSSYPVLSLNVWQKFDNIFYVLFGIGPRASGLALLKYAMNTANFTFSQNMLTSVWSIECDIADILLSCGIIGLVLYYIQILKFLFNHNTNVKTFGLAILVMGFMYNFSLLTINVILVIFIILKIISDYQDEMGKIK